MAAFEPLRPRAEYTFPEPGEESQETSAFSPLTPAGTTPREHQRLNTPMVSNMGDAGQDEPWQPTLVVPEGPEPAPSAESQIKPGALQNVGVNWEDHEDLRSTNPILRTAQAGFYNVDYDPEGKVSSKLGEGRDHVMAANVFGRQFSRDELMKDDEGRRLVHLMEVQRTGVHRDEGFWSGFASFKDTSGSYKRALGDIPFLGWVVDGGFTVGETIDVSKTMRRMQNGEQVSKHDALAVRRFMLQAEMDSERGIGYKAGEMFHSSIPFAIELATAGYLVAKTTALGTAVGGLPGAIIGAVGGLIFGGVGVAWKMLARKGATAASRQIAKGAVKNTLKRVAAAEFGKDAISFGEQLAVGHFVKDAAPEVAKAAFAEAREVGTRRAMLTLGRNEAITRYGEAQAKALSDEAVLGLGKAAAEKLGRKEFSKRASFEATKELASRYSRIVDPDMSAKAARVFLVGGDQERKFHYGLMQALEAAAVEKGGPQTGGKMLGYWKQKKFIRQLVKEGKGLTDDEMEGVVKGFIESAVKSEGVPEHQVFGAAAQAVVDSMERSLGGYTVSRSYARDVLDYLGKTTLDSYRLKYGAKTAGKLFANDMERFAKYVASGMLDGALRWDTSVFGGVGTIARDGGALGGKMNVLKEAIKVAAVEAPVRGALQMSVNAPLWPVAAAASGHDPLDFVLKGQLGIQMQALQTGDKDLMDNARAIALGAGLVEYMSENAGRGFNMFMSGIVKPTALAVLPEPTKELGSALAKKVSAIFGSEAAMKKENFAAIAAKLERRLGQEVSNGRVSGSVSRNEILRFVQSGKATDNIKAVAAQLGLKPRKLLSEAVNEVATDGKARAAALGMFSYEMMRRGWTPQKLVDVLQRVGYDGMLAEMSEERYGGFLQGLFGLNERPSDEGFRGRLAAMWEGLFPDKEQLAVEAIGFAIPSIAHLSLAHVQSRLGGAGAFSRVRQASHALNIGRNNIPEVSISGVSAQYVDARKSHQAEVDQAFTARFGTDESNRAAIASSAGAAFRAVQEAKAAEASGGAAPAGAAVRTKDNEHLFGLDSEDEFAHELDSVVEAVIAQSTTEDELEANIKRYALESLVGKDGVEAVRNLKRADSGFTDKVKRDFLETPDMKALLARTPKASDYLAPMSVNDVINRVEMTVPVRGEDMSPLAGSAGKSRADNEIRANQYGQELLGETCRNMTEIANALYSVENNGSALPKNATWGDRVLDGGLRMLSRLASVMDAVVTGDLSLAARNPVQWMLADESLDKNLAGMVLAMKKRSVRIGMARVLAEERDLLARQDEALQKDVEPLLRDIDAAYAKRRAAKFDPLAARGAQAEVEAAEHALRERLAKYTEELGELSVDKIGRATMARFEAAGEESFQQMLRDYASRYLAARNVLAVSQSDLSDAALSVVADRNASRVGADTLYKYKRSDGSEATTAHFTDAEFRESHAADIEAAKSEIVDRLVDLATSDAIRVNTNAKFSVTESTAAVIDYQRAMRVLNRESPADQKDRMSEVLAAIKAMPAFASSRVVVDLSYGGFTAGALDALGSVADVSELLGMQTDADGNLAEGDLAKVMRIRGRNFVYETPEQNQRDAKRFLRQVRMLADNMVPYLHLDAKGDRVDVTYERGTDGGTGRPFVRATLWKRDDAGRMVAATSLTTEGMVDMVSALAGVGVTAKMRRLVMADSFSLASRDATSLLLYRFGSRENAREFYRQKGVDNDHMPPLLRRSFDMLSNVEDWEYGTEEEAAAQMRREMDVAASGNEADVNYRPFSEAVYGADLSDGTHVVGYEEVARDYLRSIGMTPVVDTVEENLVVGPGEKWVFAPNAMTRGDAMFITGDYNSSGDSEALLRALLESAIVNHAAREHHAGRTGFTQVLKEICKAFDEDAEGLVGELSPLRPEWAERIRTLQSMLDGPGGSANPRKVAAIAAAALCFTSERGLGERGNGFLFSPELAAVTDMVRASPYFTHLISAVDEALGGVGLFTKFTDKAGAKVQELIDTFAPNGYAVAVSRKTSIFNRTGVDGSEKPDVPYSKMVYGGTSVGRNGLTAVARFDIRSFSKGLENIRPDSILFDTAESARVFAENFRRDVGRDMTLEDAVQLTQAAVGAGDTAESLRPEVRRKRQAMAAPSFGGGRVVKQESTEVVGARTDDVISQVAAAKLARGLAFLEPDRAVADRAMRGQLTDVEANLVGTANPVTGEKSPFHAEVERFLRSRGLDDINCDMVLKNLAIGIGEPLEQVDEQPGAESDDAAESDEADEAADEGRLHAFQDQKKAESAVKNQDLQELGSILQYIFPQELRSHTAIFYNVVEELAQISEGTADQRLAKLADALNVFRASGAVDPEGRVAGSFDFGDPAAVEQLLSDGVNALHDMGRDDLALAINMLRGLGRGRRGNTRRAKALSDIAFMSPLDAEVTRVQFVDDMVDVSASRPGVHTASVEPILRATLAGLAYSDALRGNLPAGIDDLWDALVEEYPEDPRKQSGNKDEDEDKEPDYVGLPKATTGEDGILIPPGLDGSIAAIARWMKTGYANATAIPLDVHRAFVEFANKFAKRLRDMAGEIVEWQGAHSVLASMLRNRGLAGSIVRALEHEVLSGMRGNEKGERTPAFEVLNAMRNRAFYMYGQTFPVTIKSEYTDRYGVDHVTYYRHRCQLLEELVLNPLVALVRLTGAETAEDFSAALASEANLVHALTRANAQSTVVTVRDFDRTKVFQNRKYSAQVYASGNTSALATLALWAANATPRRTAQTSVRSRDQFLDSGRAVQTPSTAPLAEYRLAESLFSEVKLGDGTWLDSYVRNGRRFDDGTYATVVTPGVEIGGRLAEGSAVARYVFEANVGRFVQDADFRNVLFQLYHGEKPTVYSQQLPGDMVAQMWKDIVAGAKYTRNRYTEKQFRVDRLRTMPSSLEELATEEDRRFAYDMLFSVVADHAGCGQIDPKRTQVLMAQGVMYAGHRDRAMVVGEDGQLVEEDLTGQMGAGGKPVTPMTRFIVSLAGDAADSDLGMYAINGYLVEAQRATATNRDAISFKNHLNAIAGVFLTKGQGHDLGLGMYESEDIPATGGLRAAQAAMRREAERILGLEKGILDLPDDAKKADADYMAKRDAAVAAVEFFRRHSTLVHTDLETQKVGIFASRNGVAMEDGGFTIGEGESAVSFRVDGKTVKFEKDGTWVEVAGVPTGGLKEGKPVPVAVAVAAYMVATGKKELDEEACAGLKAKWVTANGVSEATLAESGLLMKGDVLSFGQDSFGNYQARFGSRHIVGQVMANNDASSRMGHHSPAATNYDRDQAANQGARAHDGELSVSRILTVARAVPSALLRTEPGLADAFLLSDEQYAMRDADHPWDDTVREQRDKKLNAFRAREMRVYPTASHAVLLGSGIKADIDRATHKVKRYSYSAGVTEWDKDALRDARILPTRVAEAYGVDRTVPSGLLNVTGDASFRYGWHLNDEAFAAARPSVDKYIDSVAGAREKLDEYKATLKAAHGEDAEDTEAAALVAALVWAMSNGSKEQKLDGMKLCAGFFTDYTGRMLSDHMDEAVMAAVSFHDLFLNNDGARTGNDFDFTALEFGPDGRKTSREDGAPKTIYLGGALFSGDRRPSGNLEAASGLSRAQAPVTFNAKTGVPGKTAMYVLSPVLNAVQGSDTDGDSATVLRFSGTGATKEARDAVNAVFNYLDKVRTGRAGTSRSGKMTDAEARGVIDTLRASWPQFLEDEPVRVDGRPVLDGTGKPRMRTVLSSAFRRALGDLLFEIQVNNYRRTPTVEQNESATRGSDLAANDPGILDIGFAGRDPVGTDAVFGAMLDSASRDLYKRVTGRDAEDGISFSDAFKDCIDKLTEGKVPEFDLLDAETAAYLSGEAADGSAGRATAVSLQASIEHILAFVASDERMQSLYPRLYAVTDSGYSPVKDFLAHLDGVSNALFDVVKDLFAPRAGWRQSMLNYMVAKLLRDANSDLETGRTRELGSAWFFGKLVEYARDFHSSDLSIPGLLRRANTDNNFLDEDSFGAPAGEDGTRRAEKTFRGLMHEALLGDRAKDTLIGWLARHVAPPRRSGADDFTASAEKLFADASGDFIKRARAWMSRLLFSASTLDNTMSLASALRSAPPALRAALVAAAGGGEAENQVDTALVKGFIESLQALVGRVTGAGAKCALQGHVLFADLTQVGAAYTRASEASSALGSLDGLRNVEAGLSPEPAFRAGGEKAARKYMKTGADMDVKSGEYVHVSPDDADYLTTLFVTQDLLAGSVNEQFDSHRMSESMAGDVESIFAGISGGGAATDNYLQICRRQGVDPILSSDGDAFGRYIAALALADDTATGTIDANRRRLGRIIGVLRGGLDLMRSINANTWADQIAPGYEDEAAQARLAALLDQVWPHFLVGNERQPSILSSAIVDAVVLGPTVAGESDAGRAVAGEDILAAMRLTEDGRLGLASKLSVQHSDMLRGAYEVLRADIKNYFAYRRGASLRERAGQVPKPLALSYTVTSSKTSEDGRFIEDTANDNMTNAELAFLLQLSVAVGQPFSSVTEGDARADLTCIFSDEELRDQECWGAAAEQTLVGRALCCTGGDATAPYDLLREPARNPDIAVGMAPLLCRAVGRTAPRTGLGNALRGSPFATEEGALKALNRDPKLPVDILVEATQPGAEITRIHDKLVKDDEAMRQSRRALGVVPDSDERYENILKSSFDVAQGPDTLTALNKAPLDNRGGMAFMFVGAEELDDDGNPGEPSLHETLEEAINSLAAPGALQNLPSTGDYEKDVAAWVRGRRHGEQSFRELAAVVMRRTRDKYGDRVVDWAEQALARGGEVDIDPATFGPVRESVEAFVEEARPPKKKEAEAPAEAVRPSVVQGMEESALTRRMTRSGFAQFLQTADADTRARVMQNPIANIRFALEKVFGKSAGPGKVGVKVERVVTNVAGSRIPTSLIRVTRWYKVKERGGVVVKPAVTYIATGEAINSVQPDNNAYLDGIAGAVSRTPEEKERTLALLKGMTPAQVAAFAKAEGCSVPGVSDTGLTTNALLALTGLIRLGGGADYKTLFHEYFHQMLAFYRRTGVCTAADMNELAAKFSLEGRFDEEAAADAFADYVVAKADGAPRGKLLADGAGDDELFNKFLTTAQAFLAGATAMDRDGAPAFMKMLVTGDFTARSVTKAADATVAELTRIENMIMGEETELPVSFDWQSAGGVTLAESDVTLAFAGFRNGTATAEDVVAAVDAFSGASGDAEQHPRFKATDRPFGVDPAAAAESGAAPEPGTPPEPGEPVRPKKGKKPAGGKKVGKGRKRASGTVVAELMSAALDGLDGGALSDQERKTLGTLKKRGVSSAASCHDALAIAQSLLSAVSSAYGFDVRKAKNRERIFELAVRLSHRLMSAPPSAAAGAHRLASLMISQTKLAGFLRGIPSEKQHDAILGVVEASAAAIEAQAKTIARDKADGPDQADALAGMVDEFRRVCGDLAQGKAPYDVLGGHSLDNSWLLTALSRVFPGVKFTTKQGPAGWELSVESGYESLPGVRAALVSAARSLGLSVAFGQLLRENAKDSPAPGATPDPGPSPAIPPEDGCMEPDFSPQLLLQSQTSWMASDLHKRFFGVNLRDIMTDTSFQAATERPNARMRNLEFYLGADVLPGGRVREVSMSTSDLRMSEDGVMEANKKFRHATRKYAAVRDALGGFGLGLVTRRAKEAGEVFLLDDTDLVNFMLQTAGYVANGEDKYITGIDLSADSTKRLQELFHGRSIARLYRGDLDPRAVVDRVHGKRRGEAVGKERPTNLDQALYKIATSLPPAVSGVLRDKKGKLTGEIAPNGLYDHIVRAYASVIGTLGNRGTLLGAASVAHYAAQALERTGHALVVRNGARKGRAYLTIPVADIEKAWDASDTKKKLVGAGRNPALLSIRYAAQEIATAAAQVNRAAFRSRFIRNGLGNVVTGQNLAGLWFDSGSGGHGLAVRTFENSQDFFNLPVSNPDDKFLANKFRAFTLTLTADTGKSFGKMLESKVTGVIGGATVRGLEPAFAVDDATGMPVYIPVNRMQHLMQLLGLGARASNEEVRNFVSAVSEGLYARGSAKNPSSVDLHGEMTVFELDHAIYELECVELHKARLGEGDSILTRPESEGGYGYTLQDLVDLNEWLRREGLRMMLDEAADQKVGNLVSTVSAATMLTEFGELPSAKTGTERVRAMAESLVTSERFRGCLSQMLTTVGAGGMPNFIVSPGAGAENFAPDAYWGALARFVLSKLAILHGNRGFGYDETLSGIENMRRVADRLRGEIGRDAAAKKKPATRIPWKLVPPDDIQAGNLFGFVLALDDRDDVDEDKLDRLVGGEAMGYLKQLFGTIKSPTTWRGWAALDRVMAYSKAASVGMSAFFAFATRFESPIAACGFLNTALGYTKATANVARKVGKRLRDMGSAGKAVADFFNFEENMPYLADFTEATTSDDLSIAQTREYLDLVGMPLSDAIRNPMSDTGGQIDSDIRRLSDWLIACGKPGLAREVRQLMDAALHNPGEYAFSNVLNCVKMAVVAQTLHRLRRECERANRPFDPVRELRRFSSYINAEIGGIQPERYAWLTPGMQQVLRLAMFSYQWTMGAWTAGTGGVVTDMLFGGHSTTRDTRRFAFIRWLRMLGIVKVGVPVVMQLVIKGLAKCMSGLFGDPDDPDDKDPLGIEDMPWLCFDNESKVGALSFDVTPLLRVCGRLRHATEDEFPLGTKFVSYAVPIISAVVGAAATRSLGGALVGGAFGSMAKWMLPDYTGVGHGRNVSGKRRYYMHFGKQSDEFWRWFTDFWSQATNKLSVPTQKTVEAFFGSTNGSNFGKNFKDKPILDRFFTTNLDPQDNAIINWFTSFTPFSAASVASNPDAGMLGMFAPVQMGASLTGQQKRIAARLAEFALNDRPGDIWADPRNKKELRLLASDILRESRLNGFDPADVLKSGLGTASGDLYQRLFTTLPKTKYDSVNGTRAAETLRAMRRLNVQKQNVDSSLRSKYKLAGIKLEDPRNADIVRFIKELLRESSANPWLGDAEVDELMHRAFDESAYQKVRSVDVQQDRKGGEALANFLATDDVPETLFGIPVVSDGYTPEDLEFFRRNPKAAGFYDLGDGGEPPDEPPPEEPPPDEPPPVMDEKGGEAYTVPSDTFGADDFDPNEIWKGVLDRKGTMMDGLREFYGDKTDEIVNQAVAARMKAAGSTVDEARASVLDPRAIPVVFDPSRESGQQYGNLPNDPGSSPFSRSDPLLYSGTKAPEGKNPYMNDRVAAVYTQLLKNPRLGTTELIGEDRSPQALRDLAVARAYSRAYELIKAYDGKVAEGSARPNGSPRVRSHVDGYNTYVNIANTKSLNHEMGHHAGKPRGHRVNPDVRDSVAAPENWYYVSDNAELSAAMASLRRSVYRRSGGKVDTADPEHLRAVLREYAAENAKDYKGPRHYDGKWLSSDARQFMDAYWALRESDTRKLPEGSPWKTRGERAAEVNKIVKDPARTGQVVEVARPRRRGKGVA